jgi:hypothetical protein
LAEEILSHDYTEMNRLLSTFLDEISADYLTTVVTAEI